MRSHRPLLAALATAVLTAGALVAMVITSAPSAEAAIASSTLVNPVSNKCMDVNGGGNADGTGIIIWTCKGSANQLWTSTSAGELRVTIGGATKCLDAYNHGTANGTKVQLWSCSGGANQKWNLNSNNTITGVESGKCLDIYGNGTANGAVVQLWSCKTAGNNNQRWVPGGSTNPPPSGGAMAAPYLYMGWGSPPSATSVMSATGIKQFTMAFMLSGGGCSPAWDSQRPLKGGVDEQTINAIRGAGGDVQISFGGWSGNKLGPNCASAAALAGAYQQVINAYNLKYIDIDVENTDEFESEVVQDRILGALKIVKQNNPGITTIVTIPTTRSGPSWWGTRLINRSNELGANIDNFTIMPFDFGSSNIYSDTVAASEGLKTALKNAFGWSDATAYAHMGISGMNGLSDQSEMTSVQTWTDIRNWANSKHIKRLAYWSVNRDRPCPGGGVRSDCSGIAQNNWQFTSITAGFTG